MQLPQELTDDIVARLSDDHLMLKTRTLVATTRASQSDTISSTTSSYIGHALILQEARGKSVVRNQVLFRPSLLSLTC